MDKNSRQVTLEEGRRLASRHDMIFAEISALTGEGVQELFQQLSEMIEKDS